MRKQAENGFEKSTKGQIEESFFAELWGFLKNNKKWWLLPILLVLLLLGSLLFFSGTAAAPLIYTFF